MPVGLLIYIPSYKRKKLFVTRLKASVQVLSSNTSSKYEVVASKMTVYTTVFFLYNVSKSLICAEWSSEIIYHEKE